MGRVKLYPKSLLLRRLTGLEASITSALDGRPPGSSWGNCALLRQTSGGLDVPKAEFAKEPALVSVLEKARAKCAGEFQYAASTFSLQGCRHLLPAVIAFTGGLRLIRNDPQHLM